MLKIFNWDRIVMGIFNTRPTLSHLIFIFFFWAGMRININKRDKTGMG